MDFQDTIDILAAALKVFVAGGIIALLTNTATLPHTDELILGMGVLSALYKYFTKATQEAINKNKFDA